MSVETVTPTAIDALVRIETVRVVDRHRKVLGDLSDLARSIDDVGLLHPVTLTRDGRLIAGNRRLEACRLLGWVEVPARFVDSLDDAARLLRTERDENVCRKPMLPSELASLGDALFQLERARSRERQGTRTDLGRELPGTNTQKSKTTAVVGEALGLSGREYSELRYAHQLANDTEAPPAVRVLARDAITEMDRGSGVVGEARRLRAKVNAKRDALEAKEAALADPVDLGSASDDLWVPALRDNSTQAVEQRRFLIRHYGGKGYTSAQIGEVIGISDHTVRRIAREIGCTISADEALGVRTRKTIDSNRVVRETVHALDGLSMGVKLANLDDLDPAEVAAWASSLTESLRVLNRLAKQMKEKARGYEA